MNHFGKLCSFEHFSLSHSVDKIVDEDVAARVQYTFPTKQGRASLSRLIDELVTLVRGSLLTIRTIYRKPASWKFWFPRKSDERIRE